MQRVCGYAQVIYSCQATDGRKLCRVCLKPFCSTHCIALFSKTSSGQNLACRLSVILGVPIIEKKYCSTNATSLKTTNLIHHQGRKGRNHKSTLLSVVMASIRPSLKSNTINVSTPLVLAKLATQLRTLANFFVDAKQCGTAHAQSKTSTKNASRSSCTMYITLP